jgi:ribonuclease HI
MNIFIDGASRGNPGECAIGIIVYDRSGNEVTRFGRKIGRNTNNFAEYSALIEALNYLRLNDIALQIDDRISIYSDSELLVRQMNGDYKVKSSNIKALFQEARNILEKLDRDVRILSVDREQNKVADWIANRALDGESYRPADRSQKYSSQSYSKNPQDSTDPWDSKNTRAQFLRKVRAPKGHGAG